MRLHELKPAPGATRPRKRVGRGNASGTGTTAGKGTKGQKARSGGVKAGFRGMSSRNARMPKRRGFTNPTKIIYQVIDLDQLGALPAGTTLSQESLVSSGLLTKGNPHVKILANGEIAVPVHVVGLKVSEAARRKIEAAGGSVTNPNAAEEGPAAEVLSDTEVISDTSGI